MNILLDNYIDQLCEGVVGRIPRFIRSRCTGAGQCIEVCPVDAVLGDPRRRNIRIDRKQCIKCGSCIEQCPSKALV